MKFYEVGGAVRDEIMGIESKDVDFAVEAESFEVMELELKKLGFDVFQSKPEFFTVKAGVPKGHPLSLRTKVADFVLCRKDSDAGDGRRPESVEQGTILDDLARRDFTVNAIAKDPLTGGYIDPHNGRQDLENKTLRFVGDPMKRIKEDGLRVLRALRFIVTKELRPLGDTAEAIGSNEASDMLLKVSIERIREELFKMFLHDTNASLWVINTLGFNLKSSIFRDGLWLLPTMKGKQ